MGSEAGGSLVGLSLQPVASDAIAGWTVSELSGILGHPTAVKKLLGVEEKSNTSESVSEL